jgi:hypothetical protein
MRIWMLLVLLTGLPRTGGSPVASRPRDSLRGVDGGGTNGVGCCYPAPLLALDHMVSWRSERRSCRCVAEAISGC